MTRAGQAKGLGLLTLVDLAALSASMLSAGRLAGAGTWTAELGVAALALCAAAAAVAPAMAWVAWVRGEKIVWPVQIVPLLLAGAGQALAAWMLAG
jgi:hypothetical protein